MRRHAVPAGIGEHRTKRDEEQDQEEPSDFHEAAYDRVALMKCNPATSLTGWNCDEGQNEQNLQNGKASENQSSLILLILSNLSSHVEGGQD